MCLTVLYFGRVMETKYKYEVFHAPLCVVKQSLFHYVRIKILLLLKDCFKLHKEGCLSKPRHRSNLCLLS